MHERSQVATGSGLRRRLMRCLANALTRNGPRGGQVSSVGLMKFDSICKRIALAAPKAPVGRPPGRAKWIEPSRRPVRLNHLSAPAVFYGQLGRFESDARQAEGEIWPHFMSRFGPQIGGQRVAGSRAQNQCLDRLGPTAADFDTRRRVQLTAGRRTSHSNRWRQQTLRPNGHD